MERGLQGRQIRIPSDPEPYTAFVPMDLPPDPPLVYDVELEDLRDRANRALGRLDDLTSLLRDPSYFLYFYIRKEAVLSSQIEGTQSSLSDLLLSRATLHQAFR
jgi:Fic family protein